MAVCVWCIRMGKSSKYKVVGHAKIGFAVLEDGAILYDLLERKSIANAIRDVLRDGIGPDWNAVEAELEKRGWPTKRTSLVTEDFRQRAADLFKYPLSEITDWHVEVMIDQSLAVDTSKDHERDVHNRNIGLITDAEYAANEHKRRAYENTEKARIAALAGIQLGTPVPASVLLRRLSEATARVLGQSSF
jgi:hypothetical protein